MVIQRITPETAGRLARRDPSRDPVVVRQTRAIVSDVRERGETALRDWMWKLDRVRPPFMIERRALRRAWNTTPRDLRRAIATAVRHVERVAGNQKPTSAAIEVQRGITIESRVTPLKRVACYVPGGRFPLPSTAIMTVVPARVAGVNDIVVLCPSPSPVVLAAAFAAGASSVLRLGGAQAIAAAAYGTASVEKVEKIVGPGNAWVAAAKMLVAPDCAIDFRAGPSEIVVWSNSGKPEWIAADLMAQAEHDPNAQSMFLTSRQSLADAVRSALDATNRPSNISLWVGSQRNIVALINNLAPEHLVCDRASDAKLTVAGTTFVGSWSAQAAGDYATGSNHCLPTGGGARLRGGLMPADFVRVSSVQTLTETGLRAIGKTVMDLAMAEGLREHARSIEIRLKGSRR